MDLKTKKATSIIPIVPENFVVDDETVKSVEEWIERYKKMSSRIRIVRPCDKGFNLEQLLEAVKKLKTITGEDDIVDDWPLAQQIAFALQFDSALPGHDSEWLTVNTYVFCYHDFAFGLSYFEWVSNYDVDEDYEGRIYSLKRTPRDLLQWKAIDDEIMKELVAISKAVPKLPK